MTARPDPTGDPVVYAIGDTHLGLRERSPKGHRERPLLVADFFRWLSALPEEGFAMPVWNGGTLGTRVLRRPDRVVLLGDILELWEAENQAILLSASTVGPALARIPCAKIYVLGNHDSILHAVTGLYPFGMENLEIVGDAYPSKENGEIAPLRIGDRSYIFIHGHQFDPILHGRISKHWAVLAPVRQAGAALGDYAWVFFGLWVTVLAAHFAFPAWPMDWPMVLGLPLFWFPRIYMRFGARSWRRIGGLRYNRDAALKGFVKWWAKVCHMKGIPRDVGVVYGHTHYLDWLELGGEKRYDRAMQPAEARLNESVVRLGDKRPTLFNVSSWLSAGGERQGVVVASAFYADAQGPLFIGWDWREHRPFHIPFDFVEKRWDDPLAFVKADSGMGALARQLRWPAEVIGKWQMSRGSLLHVRWRKTPKP
jgi:UDP-2,3-diacylglucosamine pyrophosphatase LpxH